MNIKEDIIYSWNQNNKVTLFLLDHINDEWLDAKLVDKGRSVGNQFVHINNIRSFWISKVNEKVDLKIDKKFSTDKKRLADALQKSSLKMSDTLNLVFNQESIKGYKPHPIAFFTQMIAHESHHRGQIMTTITRNDFKINKSVNFGLWNWNNK